MSENHRPRQRRLSQQKQMKIRKFLEKFDIDRSNLEKIKDTNQMDSTDRSIHEHSDVWSELAKY